MPKPRVNRALAVRRKMHIYCEGEKTEPNYFRGYIGSLQDSSLRGVVSIESTSKNTPVQLVEEAVKDIKGGRYPKGDVFWVVYDRESVGKYSNSLHEQAIALAEKEGINVALSNVCFEQWLLLHFVDSDAAYSSCDDLLARSRLKAEIRSLVGHAYAKGMLNVFDLVAARVADARVRAVRINRRIIASAPPGTNRAHLLNPYTDIPKLLDAIDSFRS